MVYPLKVQDEEPVPTLRVDATPRHLPTPLPGRVQEKALYLSDNHRYFDLSP